MIPENIIFLTIPLNLIGHILYIKSIVNGKTKPNLVSWFMWMLAPFLGFFFAVKAGGGVSAIPIFMAGFGSLIIIIAAILTKNAIWKINSFDIYCGLLSLIALIFYIFTHNLSISILFAILSDALAFIPSYTKAWKFPETEYHSTYSWPIISNIVALLIIKNWSFAIYAFSIYFIITNIIMILIIYRKKILSLLQ